MKINESFKNLIPSLTQEEFNQLEQNIINEGCREAIILWNDTIVDGHNRYNICTKNNIEFKTINKEFNNEEEVREWIILNQFGRRNLNIYDRGVLALRLKNYYASKAKENKVVAVQEARKNNPNNINEQFSPISAKTVKPINTRKELSKIAGIGHDTMSKIQKIEDKATPIDKEKLKQGKTTINQVYKNIKVQEKREEIKENLIQPKAPVGLYDVIYADPPWRSDFQSSKDREIENHYPTMDIQEIKQIKLPIAEDAACFMWTTAPKLKEGIETLESWGFVYKTCCVWDKEIIGLGYWVRNQHEILLIGTKGNVHLPLPENRPCSVYREKRTEHSKKPNYYYEMIEKMCPNAKYLEVFARQQYTEKWNVWGNQCE